MAVAWHPVASFASRTLANTGRPRWVDPPFLGFTPPTTWVPYWMACRQYKVGGRGQGREGVG